VLNDWPIVATHITFVSFSSTGEVADLIEVANVDGNGDVRGVAVVEEVFEADLHGDGADDFTEAGHLEILHVPDFEHERAEVFTDEGQFVVVEIDGVEVSAREGGAEWIIGKGEGVDKVEDVGEVSPDNFFFDGGEAGGHASALLCGTGVVVRLKIVSGELIAEPAQAVGFEIEAQEFDGVGVGKVEIGIGVEADDPGRPVLMIEVSKECGEVSNSNFRVIFDCLSEVLDGIIGGAIEQDAFSDQVSWREPEQEWRGRRSSS